MYDELKQLNLTIESSGSVQENIIVDFEKELDTKFGSQYKEFVKEFGCLNVEHLEFYGICGNNKSIPSAMHATKELRKYKVNLPSDFIVFYELGDGIYYCTNREDQVWKIDLNTIIKTNKTFKQFVLDEIKKLG